MAVTSSVIVVSYRPGTWLTECLQSVLPQADEVVLVDNGSPGHEASAIGRDLGATVVRADENLGFGGGVNLGRSRAHGDIVGLLNDDATAGPGWLKIAADVLSDPMVAAVTPKVVLAGRFAELLLDDDEWSAPGDARRLGRLLHSVRAGDAELLGSLIGGGVHDLEHGIVDGQASSWRWTSGARPFYLPMDGRSPADQVSVNGDTVSTRGPYTLLNHAGCCLTTEGKAADYGFAAPDDGRFDQAAERFALSGTAAVFRAETLATLGGFSSEFFAYYEDIDWCMRARLHGLRILYDPRASVSHRLSATSGGPKDAFVRFLAHRNWLLFLARGAPADVARRFLWRGVGDGPAHGVRRAMLKRLPWAVASRARMHKLWVTTPRAVWDRWAGVDTTWDDSPARVGA